MECKTLYTMQVIDSSHLIIERKLYQRRLDRKKIAKIVAHFDERIANEPKVSAREGKYYVFDGQHTILARELRNGNNPLPILCKVYLDMTLEEEAKLFALQTGVSSKPSSGDRLRANILGHDDEALAFCKATEAAGLEIDLKGTRFERHLSCVNTALNAYRILEAERYTEALKILVDAWKGSPASLRYELIKAITEFVNTYSGKYDRETLVDALEKAGPEYIRHKILTDTKHPSNTKYYYQLVKVYNNFRNDNVPKLKF